MSAMDRCSCKGALHMAEGGSVDTDDLTKPSFRKPLIAKRREDRQDREGAKDAPLSVARGVVAGALGLPGDIEKLARAAWNVKGAHQSKKMTLPDVDSLPFFRTSDTWNEALPLRAKESRSRAAMEGFGNLVAPGPTFGLVKNAPKIVEGVEKVLNSKAEPLIAGRTGPLARQTGAVRMPGGAWLDPHEPEELAVELSAQANRPDVQAWTRRNMEPYIRNQLGTASDPLLALEAKKRTHITGRDLRQAADYGHSPERLTDAPKDDVAYKHWNVDAKGNAVRPSWDKPITYRPDPKHTDLTGRHYRTEWENLADEPFKVDTLDGLLKAKQITPAQYQRQMERGVRGGDQVTSIKGQHAFDQLALGNIPKYLQDAVDMHDVVRKFAKPITETDPKKLITAQNKAIEDGLLEAKAQLPADQLAGHDYLDDLLKAHRGGHTIDPQQLAMSTEIAHPNPEYIGHTKTVPNPKMLGFQDAVRKASDWGRYADEAKMNRSLERDVTPSDIPEYPSGHRWVSVKPEGVAAEGRAQRNCVGGYCEEMRAGDTSVYSLRDKDHKPAVTIEVRPAEKEYTGADPWEGIVDNPNDLGEIVGHSTAKKWIDDYRWEGEYGENSSKYTSFKHFLDENASPDDINDIQKFVKARQKPTIVQMKAFGNKKIDPKYRDMVQDFVNRGNWGDVDDLTYAGLEKTGDRYWQKGEFDKAALLHGKADFGKDHGKLTFPEFAAKQEYFPEVDGPLDDFIKDQQQSFVHQVRFYGGVDLPKDWKFDPTPPAPVKLPDVDNLPEPLDPEVMNRIAAAANPFAQGLNQPLRGNFHQRLEPADDFNLGDLVPDVPYNHGGDNFRNGGRVGYAIGGSISAPATVGLGTFAQGDTGGQTSVGTGGIGNPFGGGFGLTNGSLAAPAPAQQPVSTSPQSQGLNPSSGAGYNAIFRTDFGGQLPTQTVQGAPSYDLNTAAGQGMLGMTLGAGGAGADLTGTQAFMGAWNPGNDTKQDLFGKYTYDTNALSGLAKQVGYDTSGYDLGSDVSDTAYYKLYNDMNEKLKDYHYISGMSGGWNPTGDWRGADRTLYLNNGSNVLNPVTAPVDYHAREKGNWAQENPDAIAVASILAGGYFGGAALAGGAGGGVGGATAAGSGWGTTAANAVGLGSEWAALPAYAQAGLQGAAQGALTSGVTGGDPWTGALMGGLGGAGGSLGGTAAGYFNPEFAGLGKQAGSMGAKYFANQARKT